MTLHTQAVEDLTVYWVAVKELKLSYHNGYIYIYSK